MTLKEVYKKMCYNDDFIAQYGETGNGKYGKLFVFQNTNYRTLLSFLKNYKTFKDGANGVDRSLWEINANHGQEKLKQHTINMIKSKLFSKNERVYYKTRKGDVLENLPETFTDAEKWIIIYLLLIDAYFDNLPNYILKRTSCIYEDFLVYKQPKKNITDMIKNFILDSKELKIEEIFKQEYIYFDTFYKPYYTQDKEYDFLSYYVNSTTNEKEELYKFVIDNYNDFKNLSSKLDDSSKYISDVARNNLLNFQHDVFTQKYKPSGSFNKNMLIDNAKILFVSNFINENKFRDFRDFIHNVMDLYSQVENIDKGKLYQFIFNDYKDIFEIGYINVFNPNYFDDIEVSEGLTSEDEENIINKIQETTIIEDIEEIRKVSSVLKKKALERANYKCELEEFCDCSSHYFTNKKTGKNYVELHHLIPREFSNDFEKSIELIENYVSLCPRCHRYIHFAMDRERKMALHHLYCKRIGSLNLKGINIDERQLKAYYRIEE